MSRAGGLLVDGTAEEHLRIGALKSAGDAGAPLELLLDDRPGGLVISPQKLHMLLKKSPSQHHHAGGKPCVAKRRRLRGLNH